MFKKKYRIHIPRLLGMVLTMALVFSYIPAYAATTGTVTFAPTLTNDVLNNPYVGFAPNARTSGFTQNFSLVYMGVTWRELEPTKGTLSLIHISEPTRR